MQDTTITDHHRRAVAWLLRLTPGTATPEDVASFDEWYREHPAHAEAFEEIKRLWKTGSAGQRILRSNPLDDYLARSDYQPAQLRRRAFLGGALAASAAAAGYAVIHPPFALWPSLSEWAADYRTATGERRQIALANDISIDMNTQTSIALRPRASDVDRVELIAGEGVVTAGAHPFEIAAGAGTVRASNATFNIRHDADKVGVTCLAGEVLVACPAGSARVPARHRVVYSGAKFGAVTETDPAMATSWREGFLLFHDTPLSEVVDEINRYRHGRIIVANTELGRSPISGRFYLARLNEVVEKLHNAFGARVTTLPAGVIILS